MEITGVSPLTDVDGSIEVTINLYLSQRDDIGNRGIDAGEWKHTARGFINFVDLSFEVLFDEWIVAPPLSGPSHNREVPDGLNISLCRINAESSTISGTRTGHRGWDSAVNLSLTSEVFETVQLGEQDDNGDES